MLGGGRKACGAGRKARRRRRQAGQQVARLRPEDLGKRSHTKPSWWVSVVMTSRRQSLAADFGLSRRWEPRRKLLPLPCRARCLSLSERLRTPRGASMVHTAPLASAAVSLRRSQRPDRRRGALLRVAASKDSKSKQSEPSPLPEWVQSIVKLANPSAVLLAGGMLLVRKPCMWNDRPCFGPLGSAQHAGTVQHGAIRTCSSHHELTLKWRELV